MESTNDTEGAPLDWEAVNEMFLPSAGIRVTIWTLLSVVFVVGVVGNVAVLLVISFSREMKSTIKVFLLNLCIADLLFLIVCTPPRMAEISPQKETLTWYLGEQMCKLTLPVQYTVAHTSVLVILEISLERYYAICRPLRANYICTTSRAIYLCLLAWLIAALSASPLYFVFSFHEIDPTERKALCGVNDDGVMKYWVTMFSVIVFFFLPLAIVLVVYILIGRAITSETSRRMVESSESRSRRGSSMNSGGSNSNRVRKELNERRQVLFMLAAIVITFFLCLLPVRVFDLYMYFGDAGALLASRDLHYILTYFTYFMLLTNSAANPIIYNVMSSKFRSEFVLLVCLLWNKITCSQAQYYTRGQGGLLGNGISSMRGTEMQELTQLSKV